MKTKLNAVEVVGQYAIQQVKVKNKIKELKAERNVLFPECDCYAGEYHNCYAAHFQDQVPLENVCPPMIKAIGIAHQIRIEKARLSGISRNINKLIKNNNL